MEDLTRRALLASVAAAAWCWPRRDRSTLPSAGGRFTLSPSAVPDPEPLFATGFIEHVPPPPFAHCPSLVALTDGRLACAWYAGSREGGQDVAIWWAESAAADVAAGRSAWGPPRAVVDRGSAAADLERFVAKVGNSVAFTDGEGRPWIVFVSIAVGGWSGSSLNACCSNDGARTWEPAARLSLSPFLNVSELVRSAPVVLEDGGIGLPVYHECLGKFPEMLWLRPDGTRLVATKSRMAGGRSLIQPTVVPLDGSRAVALLRNHSRSHRVAMQVTADGGRSWSEPAPTPLPNPDASVAAVRLSDGRLLVAFNDSDKDRDNLRLAVSDAVGDGLAGIREWRRIATLESEPGERFAYPYMIQDAAGRVHLAYSWKMRRIRHAVFNESWIAAQPGERIASGIAPGVRA
jgi:predicted neuraminidase